MATITYPPELLPSPDEGEEAEVIVMDREPLDPEELDLVELLENDEFWDDESLTVEELKMVLRFYGIDLQIETVH